MTTVTNRKKVLTIGWGDEQIDIILRQVEEKSDVEFYHFVYPHRFFNLIKDSYYENRLFLIPDEKEVAKREGNKKLLKEIEKHGDFTINNLILSDRALCLLDPEDATKYNGVQATEIERIIHELKPDYLIGSFDTVLPGLAYLICKKEQIPYYAFRYSVIPDFHLAVCQYPSPNSELNIWGSEENVLVKQAKDIRDKWLNRDIVAPVYVSASSSFDVLKKIPFYVSELKNRFKAQLRFGKNRYLNYPIKKMIGQYFSKKSNILFRNGNLFISTPPEEPFFFFGFHMQPESTIDVWAPFYSHQYQVVEQISRSMPQGHVLCIKIHISDAENYSNSLIRKYSSIPNVRVVSPKVSSRAFIESARMIFAIQGTIALEGGLLGKPTVMFGDSPMLKFPTVTKVEALDKLPHLVKEKLKEPELSEEELTKGFSKYLENFLPASSAYWDEIMPHGIGEPEINNYAKIFELLSKYEMYS